MQTTFSNDGELLFTAGGDGTGRLWRVATMEPVGRPLLHRGQVDAVAFSPDGTYLVTATLGEVQVWDTRHGFRIGPPLLFEERVKNLAFAGKNGRTLYVGEETGGVYRWDLPAPAKGDAARIVAWTEAVTGLTLDDGGALRVLTPTDWERRRDLLKTTATPTPANPPTPANDEESGKTDDPAPTEPNTPDDAPAGGTDDDGEREKKEAEKSHTLKTGSNENENAPDERGADEGGAKKTEAAEPATKEPAPAGEREDRS